MKYLYAACIACVLLIVLVHQQARADEAKAPLVTETVLRQRITQQQQQIDALTTQWTHEQQRQAEALRIRLAKRYHMGYTSSFYSDEP